MSDKKLLLLDSSKTLVTSEKVNTWTKAPKSEVEKFIKGIITSEGAADGQKDKFRALISGIPSPWARVLLTRKAVCQDYSKEDLGNTVLAECYRIFKSEWRGLVAAYVLRPDSFEFSEPVKLVGRSVEDNSGEMSVLRMYGDMLFDELPLWTLKNAPYNEIENPACVQILYYKVNDGTGSGFKRRAVAATSPYTLLFSSINYKLLEAKGDIPWIDNDGKFYDPTPCGEDKFTIDEAQRLHAFIHNICASVICPEGEIPDSGKYYMTYLAEICNQAGWFQLSYDEIKTSISAWVTELGRWEAELHSKIIASGRKANTSIPVSVAMPAGPLAIMMSNEHTFFLSDKKLYSKAEGLQSAVEIKSSEIFMESEYIAAWNGVEGDASRNHANSPVYYLHTDKANYYLALPFTEKAINVFRNAIAEIMSANGEIRLVATAGNDGRVEVEFRAKLDDSKDEMPICKKTYQMEVIPESDGKVFIWPNFKSPSWNKYYYYSEFPSNVTGVRMLPKFEDIDFATATEDQLKDKYLVKYPVNRVSTTMHKYEIIESKTALQSVSVRMNKGGEDVSAGILMLKSEDDCQLTNSNYLKNIASLNLSPATVGIDFGSTNTCAYYKTNGSVDAKPVPFSNRRLALVGFDNPVLALAQKDELYFISNEGTISENGQIKSWMHEHDPQYLTSDGRIESISNMDKEIVGGVPVNENNISVISMDEYIINTNAGKLHYNMKWLSEDESQKRKKAFIKMIWIHLCADMVAAGNYPEKLNWSFPSAMSEADRMIMEGIFRQSVELPFDAKVLKPACKSYTEAESVCAYSIYKGMQVNDYCLSLGIDVGGSTSDILIMGNKNNINTLLTQSSIRLAGGFFFNAINSSAKFRRALFNFHDSKRTDVKILNIKDIIDSDPQSYKRAPYYLNNIFDQLHEPIDFQKFYSYLHTDVPAVFALPAYVTGILVYYSGMLVKNAIRKNNLTDINEVHMRYYGKGGRLFEWLLDIYENVAENYYRRCFQEAVGNENIRLIMDNVVSEGEKTASKKENKSEVAMGLVSDNFVNIATGETNSIGERIIENYDIIGEKGFMYAKPNQEAKPLEDLDILGNELFTGGINLKFPQTMENFNAFLDIFFRFLEVNSGGIIKDLSELKAGRNNLKVLAYIQNDPEYQKFQRAIANQQSASYRMPILIAAALSYLNNTLLPTVANQMR